MGFGGIGPTGTFQLPIDLRPKSPAFASILNAGSNAYLQLVYRDIGNGSGNWNFSNGLVVPLLP